MKLFVQDSSNPGCTVVKEGGLAMMECRDYCMEKGCNKGDKEMKPFSLMMLFGICILTFQGHFIS